MTARTLTNEHVDAIRIALHRTYHEAFDECPGDERIANAWAHLVHEHGWNPRTGMTLGLWGNLGNIDSPPGTPGTYETVPEREIIDGREDLRVHNRLAYATLDEMAVAYWRSLGFRYPMSLVAMAIGPSALAIALKVERYYTASLFSYRRALRAHRVTYDKRYERGAFDTYCGWIEEP